MGIGHDDVPFPNRRKGELWGYSEAPRQIEESNGFRIVAAQTGSSASERRPWNRFLENVTFGYQRAERGTGNTAGCVDLGNLAAFAAQACMASSLQQIPILYYIKDVIRKPLKDRVLREGAILANLLRAWIAVCAFQSSKVMSSPKPLRSSFRKPQNPTGTHRRHPGLIDPNRVRSTVQSITLGGDEQNIRRTPVAMFAVRWIPLVGLKFSLRWPRLCAIGGICYRLHRRGGTKTTDD